MRRVHRSVAALFALWFAIVLGDPGMLHACPMHGAHSVQSGASTTHDGHATTHHASTTHQSPEHESAPCTCIGHCCATTAVAPQPIVATISVAAVVAKQARRDVVPDDNAPSSPDLRLPFANGPPRM